MRVGIRLRGVGRLRAALERAPGPAQGSQPAKSNGDPTIETPTRRGRQWVVQHPNQGHRCLPPEGRTVRLVSELWPPADVGQ